MKIGELITKLEQLKHQHGDVEFQFDWGADWSHIQEEDISLQYEDYINMHVLYFYSNAFNKM